VRGERGKEGTRKRRRRKKKRRKMMMRRRICHRLK